MNAVTPKPYNFRGKMFAEPFSDVRIKGDAEFVETVAGLLRPLLACDAGGTRPEIRLRRVKDRETGESTDTWALSLGVAERGSGRTRSPSIPEEIHDIVEP